MVGRIHTDQKNTGVGEFQVSGIGKSGERKAAGSVYAGGFSHALDPDEKLRKARNQAMKFIRDALAGETSIDADMKARNDHIRELGATIHHTKSSLNHLSTQLSSLREEYDIEPDSREEQELQYLVHAEKARATSPTGRLSPEMQEKVDAITSHLSEYQKKALPMLLEQDVQAQTLIDAENEILVEGMIVRDTKIERLKTDPMRDAWEQTDAVMDAAQSEVLADLYAESVAHVEEDLKEKVEKAEEAAEKKEELEERIQETKEERKEREEITEELLEAAQEKRIASLDLSDPQSGISEMMSKLKLIEYDVKGAAVDEKL